MRPSETELWDDADAPWNDPRVAKTRIAAWRLLRGLTQEQLAERSGVSLGTLRRLERGELPNPGVRYLTNLARVLEPADLTQLFEDEWWEPLKRGEAV